VTTENELIGKLIDNYNLTIYDSAKRKCNELSSCVETCSVGIIDKVIYTSESKWSTLIHLQLRSVKLAQLGDKFASRHGQKASTSDNLVLYAILLFSYI